MLKVVTDKSWNGTEGACAEVTRILSQAMCPFPRTLKGSKQRGELRFAF